jgi:hypothetical protein
MKPWPPCGSPLGNVKVSRRSVKVLRVLFVSLPLYFYNFVLILYDLFLLLLLALHGDKQKLSGIVKEMKILVRNNHIRAEEVITHAKEELALAKLIWHGADRDLV